MYPFTNDVMNVEISGKDLKAMMSHAAYPKNGMLHVSKTAKFKHYNTKPLGQRIVEFDIKGKQVADKTFSTVALTPLSVKAVADLTSRKVKMSKTLKGCKPRRQLLIIWNISITSFRITPCVLTTSVNKTTLMRSLPGGGRLILSSRKR